MYIYNNTLQNNNSNTFMMLLIFQRQSGHIYLPSVFYRNFEKNCLDIRRNDGKGSNFELTTLKTIRIILTAL